MTRFQFSLADSSDDDALRQRMNLDVMDGSIAVSFRREPSYFLGTGVQGEQAQVIKCVDTESGRLAGLGTRLQLDAFINGQQQRIGYLSDLRGDPRYRGGTLLARGYRYLRQLHDADPIPFYYSLILEGNESALKNLPGARAGLPVYHDMGKILTPAIHLDLPRKTVREPRLRIQTASIDQLPEVFKFIQKQYAKKQFAPIYQIEDMASPRLSGLRTEDILIAIRGNKIVGTLAAWDQHNFRQTHIERYSRTLKILRPFYNLAATLSPLKPLPATGNPVPYFYLALVAIENDDANIFRALLSKLHNQRRSGEWHYFIAGLHEKNPLSKVLAEYRSIKAAGHLYLIYYPDNTLEIQNLDDRIPHIEIAAV